MEKLVLVVSLLLAQVATAAPPQTLLVQGALGSAGGVLAPDGDYLVIVSLWDLATEGAELWKETLPLTVAGGLFSAELGLDEPLTSKIFTTGSARFVQFQVGAEPAFERRPLGTVPYAWAAGGLACTGCVTTEELDSASVAGLVASFGVAYVEDLAAVALSGKYSDLLGSPLLAPVAISGQYTDLLGTPNLAPVATSGVYGDLTGRPSLAPVAEGGKFSDLTDIPAGLADGDNNTTYTGATFALSSQACPSGSFQTGVAPDGKPVCASTPSQTDLDLAWMTLHAAAAAACRGSTATGGSGCCGNVVRVRNTASSATCSSICTNAGENCDGEVSVWGRAGRGTTNGEAVGSFYNYGCAGSANGGSEANASDAAALTTGYWSFCCCRK